MSLEDLERRILRLERDAAEQRETNRELAEAITNIADAINGDGDDGDGDGDGDDQGDDDDDGEGG